MKNIFTIAITLFIITSCSKDDTVTEPTNFELLTKKEWNVINIITYNDENEEIENETFNNVEYLFLNNNDVLIYNNTIPENILKWQLINDETTLKLIPYEDEDEQIWKIETLSAHEFIISKKSNPTAVIQTKEVVNFNH